MSKKGTDRDSHGHAPAVSTKAYKDSLRHRQVELVKLQRHFIKCNDKWTLVRANDKRLARLNLITDLLGRLHYAGKDKRLIRPDPQIVFAYDVSSLANGQLAK